MRDSKGMVIPGRKTNLVYTVDAVQGVGVFEVSDMPPDLPVTGDDGPRGAFPAPPTTVEADRSRTGPAIPTTPSSAVPRGATRRGVQCLSKRSVTITVPGVGKSRLRSVSVRVNGKKIKAKRRGRKQVRVTLAKRLRGSYTVRISGRTRGGKRVSTVRRYKTCAPKRTTKKRTKRR
jgi:hypothetical protein